MRDTFFIKRGDTAPRLVYALSPAETDLTGATVRFSMRPRAGGAVVISRAAATIITAIGSPTVAYDWQVSNTETAGQFEAEFEVTYASGRIETFPNAQMIPVLITADIA